MAIIEIWGGVILFLLGIVLTAVVSLGPIVVTALLFEKISYIVRHDEKPRAVADHPYLFRSLIWVFLVIWYSLLIAILIYSVGGNPDVG